MKLTAHPSFIEPLENKFSPDLYSPMHEYHKTPQRWSGERTSIKKITIKKVKKEEKSNVYKLVVLTVTVSTE